MTWVSGDSRAKHPLELPRPDQQWRHIVSACMVEAGCHSPGWHVANGGVRRAHLPIPLFDSAPDLIREWWETFWRAVEIADGAGLGIVHRGGPNHGCWIEV